MSPDTPSPVEDLVRAIYPLIGPAETVLLLKLTSVADPTEDGAAAGIRVAEAHMSIVGVTGPWVPDACRSVLRDWLTQAEGHVLVEAEGHMEMLPEPLFAWHIGRHEFWPGVDARQRGSGVCWINVSADRHVVMCHRPTGDPVHREPYDDREETP